MLLNHGVGEDSWESLGLQGDPTSPSSRKSVLSVHWQDWCWSWNSSTSATWCKELTRWKRPWCWERWKTGGEGDDRGWDGWMASPTQWTWVWVDSGNWWWTRRPGMLQSMGSQRVGQDWETDLNWTDEEKEGRSREENALRQSYHRKKSLFWWKSLSWDLAQSWGPGGFISLIIHHSPTRLPPLFYPLEGLLIAFLLYLRSGKVTQTESEDRSPDQVSPNSMQGSFQ